VSHPFGDLLTQYLHRKHGLSQGKLAAGILQAPSIISEMCQGKRLRGAQERERVTAILAWLQQQDALTTLEEANALLSAAGMAPLQERDAAEAFLIHTLCAQAQPPPLSIAAAVLALQRSPAPRRHNLPTALTAFVGRREQIAQLVQHLQTHRLLTLTGAGGVGKTRLALAVAAQVVDRFADGVWFVDLAPLTDPYAIPQRILDLWGVPEQSAATPLATLIAYLSPKQTLLLLDNCEHLIGACAELMETLLLHCDQLSLLATSREALNLQAELAWRVPSLTRPRTNPGWSDPAAPPPSPMTPEALLRFEAVALFVERARSRQPGFTLTMANAPAIAQICSRLDGIPLALEMAAARVHVFTIEEMATRLDGVLDARFQLLTGGARTAPLRHQTLRATLEWSYTLLTPTEQRLLRRLSVFTGGWTVAAAEAVTGATLDLLAQLVNKSLVIADQQAGQTRYRLLETVRQFAVEQAMTDVETQRQVQRQHSSYYLHLLGEQEERLQSQQQRTALDILRADFANISAAWQWAVDQHEFALLDPAIHALFLYCDVRGRVREGFILFTDAATQLGELLVASPADGLRPAYDQTSLRPLWARLNLHVGACEVTLGNQQRGEQALQEALPLITQDWERIFVLEYLGMTAASQGELTLARTHLSESLAISQRCDDWAGMAGALQRFMLANSDYPEGCRLCVESLALWRKVGRPDRIASVIVDLGWFTWCVGDYAAASTYLQEGLALCEELDLPNAKAWAVNSLGYVAWSVGEMAAAEQLHLEALSIYTALGRQGGVGMCKADLSLALAGVGRVAEAISLAQEAVAIMRAVNNQMMLTMSLNWLSVAYLAASNLAAARDTLVEVIQRAWEHRYLFSLMIAFYYVAELLALECHPALSDAPMHQALMITVLSFVRTQTATWQFFKDKAAKMQAKIEESLPADLRATAIARGQSCTMEEMVATLLGQWG
jgi:predicted ATPase